MYKKMRLADTVRIAPELLGEPVEQAVKIALREKLDGLVHVSQLTDEFVTYDEKNSRLITKESGRSVTEGDHIRARIIAVSLNEREPRDSKIGLTMRQHALGKLEWLEEARKPKEESEVKDKPKKGKPEKKKKEESPKTEKAEDI